MRVFQLLHDLYIIELDIKELVNGFEGALDRDIVLEFNSHFMVDKSLEKAKAHKSVVGKRGALACPYDRESKYLKNSIAQVVEAVVVFAPTWTDEIDPHLDRSWRLLLFPFNAAARAILDIHQRIGAIQAQQTRRDQR